MSDGSSDHPNGERAGYPSEAPTLELVREIDELKRRQDHTDRVLFGDPTEELGRKRGALDKLDDVIGMLGEVLQLLGAKNKLPKGTAGDE